MPRKAIRIGLELVAWPTLCLALLYGFAASGILDKSGWDEAMALGRAGAAHMEVRAMAQLDKLVREELDPVLHEAMQHTEARLQESLAPYVPALPLQRQHASPPALRSPPPGLENTHQVQGWKQRAF